jgi:5-methylcytosine-specific restriction endonuclease McrA
VPALPPGWSTVATAPRSGVLPGIGPYAMMTYGRVPAHSPPNRTVIAGPEIPTSVLIVKQIWVVFHDALYLGAESFTLHMPSEFKATRHRPRVILNPYTSKTPIRRENLDPLEEEWLGNERRQGTMDHKGVVYQRDAGICGICGNFVPWDEAEMDHKIPRHRFKPPERGDTLDNLWILHREPCHSLKTKRDLQGGGRVR